MLPLFNPTLEISVRGDSVRDMLYQLIGNLSVSIEAEHQMVQVITNSSFICNAINTLAEIWKVNAGADGVWQDSQGNAIPHQALLEVILKFKARIDLRVFLCGPVTHNTD